MFCQEDICSVFQMTGVQVVPHDDCIPPHTSSGPGQAQAASRTRVFRQWLGAALTRLGTPHTGSRSQCLVMMVEPGLDTSVHFTARPASSCTASTGWSVLARPCTAPGQLYRRAGVARRYLSSAPRPPQPTTPLSFVTATTICCFC